MSSETEVLKATNYKVFLKNVDKTGREKVKYT